MRFLGGIKYFCEAFCEKAERHHQDGVSYSFANHRFVTEYPGACRKELTVIFSDTDSTLLHKQAIKLVTIFVEIAKVSHDCNLRLRLLTVLILRREVNGVLVPLTWIFM